jgi:hypothetical protein
MDYFLLVSSVGRRETTAAHNGAVGVLFVLA